ncbi:MAG: hypothetical protein ACK5MN_06225 [Lachnospiraceae bacterium]
MTLWLDGRPRRSAKLVKLLQVREDGNYMRAYVHNGKGELERIIFDFVKVK